MLPSQSHSYSITGARIPFLCVASTQSQGTCTEGLFRAGTYADIQEALVLERQYLHAQLEREEAAAAAAGAGHSGQAVDGTGASVAAEPERDGITLGPPVSSPQQAVAADAAADDSLDTFMSTMDRQVEVHKVRLPPALSRFRGLETCGHCSACF